MEEKENKRRGHKYSLAAPIGGLFVILAVIGLITVIVFSVQATGRLLDNSKAKERFERIILPVLMFDPVPFEDPSELNQLVLVRSSIWSALIENINKYVVDDAGRMLIPKVDVDVACARLYGPQIQLEHQSFDDYMVTYYYDEEKESYLVPVDAETVLYTPEVEEIRKEGDIFSLTVGYLSSSNDWLMSLQGEKYEPMPGKYMIYQLKKVEDHYQLIAVKDPPEGAVPGVPPIQPQENIVPVEPLPEQLPVTPEEPEKEETEQQKEQTGEKTDEAV